MQTDTSEKGLESLVVTAMTGHSADGPVQPERVAWRLPTYGALDATSPFLGGAVRYLVGSAYLEWLERRKGPESLNHLWRRMRTTGPEGDILPRQIQGTPLP